MKTVGGKRQDTALFEVAPLVRACDVIWPIFHAKPNSNVGFACALYFEWLKAFVFREEPPHIRSVGVNSDAAQRSVKDAIRFVDACPSPIIDVYPISTFAAHQDDPADKSINTF